LLEDERRRRECGGGQRKRSKIPIIQRDIASERKKKSGKEEK